MKLFKISILILFAGLTSCKKNFSEVNTNNNNPTGVTPDLLLRGVIKNMMELQVNEAGGIGNMVGEHHSKIQFVNEDRYGWNEKNDIWNSVYSNYRNLQNVFTEVGENTNSPYYGVGLILKSWMFSQV